MFMPKWKNALMGAALIVLPVSAQAQDGAAAVASEPAADRLAAATRLISVIMPAEQRDAMLDQMMKAVMATMTASVKKQPELVVALQNPKVEAVFDRFLDRQQQQTTEQLKAGMPDMMVAMARAYARRFTASQLMELHAFFSTPTGRTYVRESFGILSDPDIAAWQQDLMTKSFAKLPSEVEALRKELKEVSGTPIEEPKA